LNHDHLTIFRHLHLRRAREIPGILSHATHRLHRRHQFRLLIRNRPRQRIPPVWVIRQHRQHAVKARDDLDRKIPRLVVNPIPRSRIRILPKPRPGRIQLIGKRSRRHHLRQEHIRIERNRRNEFLKFRIGIPRIRPRQRNSALGKRIRPGEKRNADGQNNNNT